MSNRNSHMGLKPAGIRGGIAKFTTTTHKPTAPKLNELYNNLMKQMEHIHTWEDFNRGCIAEDLYGNTKHTDLKIIPHFFNHCLNMSATSITIGYTKTTHNAQGHKIPTSALDFRLRRMRISNLFEIIQVFISKNLIDIKTIREILRIDGHFNQKHATSRRSKFYRYYAKWYVTDIIKHITDMYKYAQTLPENTDTTYNGILHAAAKHIGVSTETLQYWIDLEVEDIMVKPG